MNPESKHRNRATHQHWVPQFYMRYFATPESRDSKIPKVWIFSKHSNDGDEQLQSVRKVCGKRYLYTPVDVNGERNWELEERLGNIETLLGEIWPALAEDYVSLKDNSVRKGLALFVALMHLRNLEVRKKVEIIHRCLVGFYESSPFLPDGTPDVREIEISGKLYEVDRTGWQDYRAWSKNNHDRFFANTIQSEAGYLANMLLLKRWSVVSTTDDSFITTDKPVALHHTTRTKFGFGTPGVFITFPLSPKRLLVMDDMHAEPSDRYYPLRDGNAGSFNLTTWQNGSRFMITGRPIRDVLNEMLALDPTNDV